MKFLFLIITFLFIKNIYSQNNYTWSEQGAIWTYLTEGQKTVTLGTSPSYLKRIVTKSVNATNISSNGQFYYDSYSFSHSPMENGATFLPSYDLLDDYEFAFYDDVIYFKQPEFSKDSINWIPADDTIVNFNASIGDTWEFHDPFADPYFVYQNHTSGISTVLDTGSRIINGETLKWILVEYSKTDENLTIISNSYSDTIFEKMGPKRNMIPSEYFYGFDSNFDGGSWLACYSDDSFLEHTIIQNVCDYFLNVDELSPVSFKIYPNPTTGTTAFTLFNSNQFSNGQEEVYEVHIADLQGKLIKTFPLNNLSAYSEFFTEDQGVYLIHLLKNGERIETQKLVFTK
jgi:hypothetical protein